MSKEYNDRHLKPLRTMSSQALAQISMHATDSHVSITLPDGRMVDVFPSGNVQVYTADGTHGIEVALPHGWIDGGTLKIANLG